MVIFRCHVSFQGGRFTTLDIQNPPEVWCLSRMFWGSKYLQFRRLDVEGKFFFGERKTIIMMLCTPPKTSISHEKIVVGRRLSVWKGPFLGFLGCFLGATQIPKSLPNDARNEAFLVSMCFIHGWLYPETSVIRSFAVFGGQKLANHWRSVLNGHWNICFRQRWFWKTRLYIFHLCTVYKHVYVVWVKYDVTSRIFSPQNVGKNILGEQIEFWNSTENIDEMLACATHWYLFQSI